MALLKCAWCGNTMKDKRGFPDGYYIAWDWDICRKCWMEMEEIPRLGQVAKYLKENPDEDKNRLRQ